MALQLSAPKTDKYQLEKTDAAYPSDDEQTHVVIRQALQGERDIRDREYTKFTRKYDVAGDVTVHQDITYTDILRLEVFLTLCECNIKNAEGKDLFEFREGKCTSEEKFKRAWAILPPLVADEIIEKVHNMNPLWDFLTPGES